MPGNQVGNGANVPKCCARLLEVGAINMGARGRHNVKGSVSVKNRLDFYYFTIYWLCHSPGKITQLPQVSVSSTAIWGFSTYHIELI